MIRWYVSYFALTHDDKKTFDYVIVSTVHEYFPIKQVIDQVTEESSFQKVTILNWKKIHEIEYLHHEGKLDGISGKAN